MQKIYAAITAVNGYVPEYVLTNQELEAMVDTNDEWITSRTGIKERRILKGEGLATSDLAVPAVKGLLEKRGIGAEEIELIIFCTTTPDMPFPATANILADKIGAKNAWGYDLQAACSGFVFGLATGAAFAQTPASTTATPATPATPAVAPAVTVPATAPTGPSAPSAVAKPTPVVMSATKATPAAMPATPAAPVAASTAATKAVTAKPAAGVAKAPAKVTETTKPAKVSAVTPATVKAPAKVAATKNAGKPVAKADVKSEPVKVASAK